MSADVEADAIVIGAGIAGASTAYFMAANVRVIVLERELQPGLHSTGRSAALYIESYGSEQVRALTRASRDFLEKPPAGFSQYPLLSPRGALVIGSDEQVKDVVGLYESVRRHCPSVRLQHAADLRARVPVLEPGAARIGLFEPGAADIDVNELHRGYLRGVRAHGGDLICGVSIDAIEYSQGRWRVHGSDQLFCAPLLINAAGAWADEVATLAGVAPIGIEPRRRSAFLFAPPEGVCISDWPFVMGVDESFYFKPDAGLILGSPANADPVSPHDVQPEEIDIALGIDRIEQATTMRIRRPTRVWAGLRSFVSDGNPVGGFSPDAKGFFWVAAQGGYGVQTSAAMGEACAHLVLERTLPARLLDAGVSRSTLDLRSIKF